MSQQLPPEQGIASLALSSTVQRAQNVAPVLERLVDQLIRDSNDSVWGINDSELRESLGRVIRSKPDILYTTIAEYNQLVGELFNDLNNLGSYMLNVSCENLAEDLQAVRDSDEQFTRDDMHIHERMLTIKRIINLLGPDKIDREKLYGLCRTILVYSWGHHDLVNLCSNITTLVDGYSETTKQRMVDIGLHCMLVGNGGANMIQYGPTNEVSVYLGLADRLKQLTGILSADRCSMEIDCDSTRLRADTANLYRVGGNLVSNAIIRGKATKIKFSVTETPTEVAISIADNGRGLPNTDLIFGYGQSYSGSTGLGLYFSRLVVEAHGGRIIPVAHNSDPIYSGAQFTVVLPKKNKSTIYYPELF